MLIRLLLLILVVAALSEHAQAAETRLNVLFIAVDDLRPEMGSYGGKAKTPHMDTLASSSLQFDRAYCQLALCNPSRASLLAGRRPETLKVFDLGTFLRKHSPGVVTLPQLFRENGYTTRRFGKIYHTSHGNSDDPLSWTEGEKAPNKSAATPTPAKKARKKPKAAASEDPHADELPFGAPDCPDDALTDGKIARDAIQALRNAGNAPFFLAVGFHRPHLPFVAPRKYWDLYDPKSLKLPSNSRLPKDAPPFASNNASEIRRYKEVPKEGPLPDSDVLRLLHGYYASTSYVDAQIGKLLAELDRLDLRKNTIVILWGDHGYHLGEQGTWNKRTNWEVATRAPLLISVPGQKIQGSRTRALVEFVDIYPTLAELCALPLPAGLEGTSFAPLLDNPERPWKKAAFSIYQKDIPGLGKGFGRAMRTDRYRFVEWSAPETDRKVFELYDHASDPGETTNLANRPENQELVASLSRQLADGWKAALPLQ